MDGRMKTRLTLIVCRADVTGRFLMSTWICWNYSWCQLGYWKYSVRLVINDLWYIRLLNCIHPWSAPVAQQGGGYDFLTTHQVGYLYSKVRRGCYNRLECTKCRSRTSMLKSFLPVCDVMEKKRLTCRHRCRLGQNLGSLGPQIWDGVGISLHWGMLSNRTSGIRNAEFE